jgi:MerR family transcriptional regulator/heat shock protein HspR|uniref:MerR family transcriptional regulator n=1 Tax=Desulfobacca acetoxidans TaxID=60893 RepID=A0A7V6DQM1_9BACT
MTPQDQDTTRKVPIIFTRTVAAQLARVPLEFLEQVEAEDLIRPREVDTGECGYTPEDITRLARIRRLHETLGLELAAVDVILRLRERVTFLLSQMEDMETRFARREQELLRELEDWRRRFLVARERG